MRPAVSLGDSGNLVNLSSNYKYHYVSNNGDVIETDDATYQPPVGPKTSWSKMDRVN